jgi:hypothetical protein
MRTNRLLYVGGPRGTKRNLITSEQSVAANLHMGVGPATSGRDTRRPVMSIIALLLSASLSKVNHEDYLPSGMFRHVVW